MAHTNSIFELPEEIPTISSIEIAKIRENPYQPRKFIPPGHIENLKASIQQHGQLEPITVLPIENVEDEWMLINGQCRILALTQLGQTRVQACIRDTGKPGELALIMNRLHESLHPIDQAAAYAQLIQHFGYTHGKLAEVMTEDRTSITELLSLNVLPDYIKEEAPLHEHIGKFHLIELARLVDQPDVLRNTFERMSSGERVTVSEIKDIKRKGAGQTLTSSSPAGQQNVPKALRSVNRLIDTTHQVHQKLAKIDPSLMQQNPDKLETLRQLNRDIGAAIHKLAGIDHPMLRLIDISRQVHDELVTIDPANVTELAEFKRLHSEIGAALDRLSGTSKRPRRRNKTAAAQAAPTLPDTASETPGAAEDSSTSAADIDASGNH